MADTLEVQARLKEAFSDHQSLVLARVIVDTNTATQRDLVKASDFNELKDIVRNIGVTVQELAEAQKRTERKVEELAEAQKRTEHKVEELAEAQKRTEEEIRMLTRSLGDTRTAVGGLSRSVSYSLENEAYRALPAYLKQHYGIELTQKFIRTEIQGEEINLLGKGKKNGQEVWVVGESEVKLTSVKKFQLLQRKVEAVKRQYGESTEVVALLLAHYATAAFLSEAQARGILVIQSFEW